MNESFFGICLMVILIKRATISRIRHVFGALSKKKFISMNFCVTRFYQLIALLHHEMCKTNFSTIFAFYKKNLLVRNSNQEYSKLKLYTLQNMVKETTINLLYQLLIQLR